MIYLFLADGMEEIEALCPLDLLRRAGLCVQTVSITDSRSVVGSHRIKVEADVLAKDVDLAKNPPSMLIFPGGMPGSANLDASSYTDTFLQAATKNGAILCAICAAPMVLGHRGLLAGKRATCFPGFESELQGAILVNEGVVQDEKVITAAGMGWAQDFGLALVRCACDNETAEKIGKAIAPHAEKE
jgi:4-methyl-5(b-hydroxyethyl)-thiazole monophosphate biosynthesis